MTEQLIAAPCSVDLQDKDGLTPHGLTPLHFTVANGRAAVTKQLIAAHCNVDIQSDNVVTVLQFAELYRYPGIVTLIRNKKHKGADRGGKDTLLQGNPEQITKQFEDVPCPHHPQVLSESTSS